MAASWTPNRNQVIWLLAGVVIVGTTAFVLLSMVGAIVVGIFLYYAVRPVYRWLDGHLDHPDVTATLTLAVVGVPILFVLGYAALLGIRELDEFLGAAGLQQLRTVLKPYVDVAELTNRANLADAVRRALGPAIGYVNAALMWVLRLFVVFTVAFYLLRDDHKIGTWYRETFGAVEGAVPFGEEVDDDLGTLYTGNLLIVAVSAAVAIVTYYALDFVAPPGTGVAFPLLLGLVTGVFTLVPAIGMKLVYVPYTGWLLFRSVSGDAPLWFPIVFFAVVLVAVDLIPDVFVRSYLSKGRRHMGLVLLSYVLVPVTFGWYGIFLGPIVLVVAIHFAQRILPSLVDPRQDEVDV